MRNLRVITGHQINDEEYLSICRKIKILITNLKKDNSNFLETFFLKSEDNSLILAIEVGNKNVLKLAIKAQLENLKSGAYLASK